MRASLADQLEVEDLRKHFRKYAAGRAAPELPDFYKVNIRKIASHTTSKPLKRCSGEVLFEEIANL